VKGTGVETKKLEAAWFPSNMISNTPRFDPKPNIPKDSHDMYIVYLYNHETLLHLQHVSIRWMIIFVFFQKKIMLGF